MSLYKKHVFICENIREKSDPRGSCSRKGSPSIRLLMKEEIARRGLKGRIRINKAGCLGTCKQGVSMVIYPDEIWYGKITKNDIEEIIEETILQDRIIDRLLMTFMRKK
ncbi:MAG: (2Fe-2S) ferredoxin domain-containing protein [Calditrichaeota bacterium]|nr:MAG: (2Fe-2S) ferredoxin domain-containing protein [Calditrichota bacterium]